MNIIYLLAALGHIFCGITDCLFAYTPNGRFDMKDARDSKKMSAVFEGMPLVLLEALAVGLPIVTFNYMYGADEIVKEGQNGFIVFDLKRVFRFELLFQPSALSRKTISLIIFPLLQILNLHFGDAIKSYILSLL